MKKITSVILSTVMCLSFIACSKPTAKGKISPQTQNPTKQNVLCDIAHYSNSNHFDTSCEFANSPLLPDYQAPQVGQYVPFRFAAYMTPPQSNAGGLGKPDFITDKHYSEIEYAGFNYVYAIYESEPVATMRALEKCDKYGLKMLVQQPALAHGIVGGDYTVLSDSIKQTAETELNKYKKYNSFAGIVAGDEISKSKFNNAKIASEFFKEKYPDKEFYFNLAPIVASPAQLGCSGATEAIRYQDHVDSFVDMLQPNFISFDNYTLLGAGDSASNKKIQPQHLENLAIVAKKAKDNGIPFYTFLLTLGHMDFRTLTEYDDIAWQVYSSMAFGATGAQTFTYWTTMANEFGVTHGLIDKDGNKTATYYAVKAVIDEVQKMEAIYSNFTWQGVMANAKNNTVQINRTPNLITAHQRIKSYNSTSDLLLGIFKDADNMDGFMLSNYADPYNNTNNTVTIEFNNATHVLIVGDNTTEKVSLVNGVLTKSLPSGKGLFLIPLSEAV